VKRHEVIGILIALVALIVAVLNYLFPFEPVGPSPFSPQETFVAPQAGGQLPTSTPVVVTVVVVATPKSPTQSASAPESPQTTTGKIVFDSPVNGKWQVFIVNPDGSGLRQLTNIADGIGDPAISPDGTLIVFVGDGGKRIYVMNADGTHINSVYETNTEAGWPSWSPDSKKIVFAAQVKGRKNLFLMNSDGTGLSQLTDVSVDDLAPSFSPDGNYVVFSSNRSGKWEIYKLTLTSREIVRLTDLGDPTGQGWPSWSPDGLSIAFESRGNANSRDIFTMYADGTQIQNITDNPKYEGAPVWSPDGKKIAFASDRDGSLDIYLVQNDGTQIQRLTRIWAWGPSWSCR
jgi:Tol biopolymer transport system component